MGYCPKKLGNVAARAHANGVNIRGRLDRTIRPKVSGLCFMMFNGERASVGLSWLSGNFKLRHYVIKAS
jgi:hypothetical protein